MKGASLRAVAELLGHQTMQMTMRYAHLSPGISAPRSACLMASVIQKGQKKGNALDGSISRDRKCRKCLRKMARPARLELATSWFVA
jgi:hypothetical protein